LELQSGVAVFVAFLMVASAVAVLAERLPIPYETVLALVGLAVGAILGEQNIHVTGDLLLFVFLPGLLFEAGFNLHWGNLREHLVGVALLATVGAFITTAVVALLGVAALGLALPVAFLFGAMVSPTDPVAVIAIFRQLGVPDRLTTLVEGESLLNDGTGLVLFSLALAIYSGAVPSVPQAILDMLYLSLGGLAVGIATGFALSWLTARINFVRVELTFTAIGAYGSYLVAEWLHASGILAVVAAALVLGNFGRPRGMAPATEAAVTVFWDYVAFVLNSAIFLLIGMDIPWQNIGSSWLAILVAAIIVLVARAVAVYGVMWPARLAGRGIPWRWKHLMVWSGLRGAVAIALTLSLIGNTDPQITLIQTLTYGVALLSIVVQGGTIGPISRWLLGAGSEATTPL
jgi:CPA1 family monovalent cation:H+ antiporter